MRFDRVRDAMLSVMPEVYHYHADSKGNQYIVWAEHGSSSSPAADNVVQEQVVHGTIDYFTREEYDQKINEINEALKQFEIANRLKSVQYEPDTDYTHYEWSWELI